MTLAEKHSERTEVSRMLRPSYQCRPLTCLLLTQSYSYYPIDGSFSSFLSQKPNRHDGLDQGKNGGQENQTIGHQSIYSEQWRWMGWGVLWMSMMNAKKGFIQFNH